tara:strand:- start:203 stop:520 length:318 start_codon:yes stop_codon:yes gene_type:complete
MKNKLNISIVEYLSLILVLSFFIIHNIYLELIGISLALLSINKSIIISIINKIVIKEKKITSNPQKNTSKNLINIKEKSILSLLETIEESGFIPSIDKDEDNNAA